MRGKGAALVPPATADRSVAAAAAADTAWWSRFEACISRSLKASQRDHTHSDLMTMEGLTDGSPSLRFLSRARAKTSFKTTTFWPKPEVGHFHTPTATFRSRPHARPRRPDAT